MAPIHSGWWLEHVLFFHILGIIIPTDELIFFRGVETTNQRKLAVFFLQKGLTFLIALPRHLQEIDVDFR